MAKGNHFISLGGLLLIALSWFFSFGRLCAQDAALVDSVGRLLRQDSAALAEKDTAGRIRVLIDLGNVYYEVGLNEEALSFNLEGLGLSETIGMDEKAAVFRNNIGLNLMFKNDPDYPKAYGYMKSVDLAACDSGLRLAIISNMGYLSKKLGDTAGALSYFTKALEMAVSKGDVLREISLRLYRMEMYTDKAIFLREYGRALDKFLSFGNPLPGSRLNIMVKNLLVYAYQNGKFRDASRITSHALKLKEKAPMTPQVSYNFYSSLRTAAEQRNAPPGEIALFKEQEFLAANSLIENGRSEAFLKEKQKAEMQKLMATLKVKDLELQLKKRGLEKAEVQRNFLLISGSISLCLLIAVSFIVYEKFKSKSLKEKQVVLEKKLLQEKNEKNAQSLESQNLLLLQRRRIVQKSIELIRDVYKGSDIQTNKRVHSAIREMKSSLEGESDFELIKKAQSYDSKSVLGSIHHRHPELTQNDLKIVSVLLLNLSTKETARLLDITRPSLNAARYRIRKKVGIRQEEDLLAYFSSF